MTYIRKTRDVWAVQELRYGTWEAVSHYLDKKEARVDMKLYRESDPYTAFRLKLTYEYIQSPAGWDFISGGGTA